MQILYYTARLGLITALCLLSWVGRAQVDFTSSNLPIVVINTDGAEIVDEPKINVFMGIINNGPGVRNNITDPFTDYEGTIGIEIRGSTSQRYPKKQYTIELRDPLGEDSAVSLLGMPKESDWVLHAPYSDKSLMRNILAYQLGRDLGRYAPRTRLCEVVLNGDYQGVYALVEKIKRDKNRVDIAKLEEEDISGDDITGGYIIKIDKDDSRTEEQWFSAYPPPHRSGDQRVPFRYEYPDEDEMAPEQKDYIQQYVREFEEALAGDNFTDPEEGYAKYIDVNSFIDLFIVNEVSKDIDAYRLSTYMYKQNITNGGKLVMGPLWDYNFSFGNVEFCTDPGPEGLALDFSKSCPDEYWLAPFWWERFLEDSAYSEQLAQRWAELRENQLATEQVMSRIDSVATLLNEEAQQRNFTRWPILGEFVWPNAFVGNTYQEEVDHLKDWTSRRLAWLDETLPKPAVVVPDTVPTDSVPVAFSSSNLPIVVINTNGAVIVDNPKVNVAMGIIDNGLGNRNNLTDPFNNFEGRIGIEFRGSDTPEQPKKQYGFEVRDADSKDQAESLLGMSKEADWVLHAPYSDKSLMRDMLAYQLSRSLGRYAPRTRFCELVVDGSYQGVYVLVEKIKRDKDRVDIAKLKEEDLSGDDVTGGYILTIDKLEEGSEVEGWTSTYPPLQGGNNQTISFKYDYPKPDDIAPEQQAYIQQYVASFEDALTSDNFADPETGYAQYIDVASFVDYFIASEVARNPDAYRVNAFLHKQKITDGGKLFMGPIWDFNLGFGNVDYCIGGGTEGLAMDFNSVCPDEERLIPFWWDRLFQDSAFVAQVGARWAQLRSNPLATERVLAQADSAATLLNEAQERNFTQWPILGVYIPPNAFIGQTYQEEVDQLKNWISARMSWLDANLSQEDPEPPVVTGTADGDPYDSDLVAYPVPFRDALTVEFTTTHAGVAALQVRDLLGRTVLRSSSYYATSGQQRFSWDTSSLPPGVYVMQWQIGNQPLITRKINKQ